MADDRLKNSNYDDEDFSGSFTEDDFNSTDLFGEDLRSEDYHVEPDAPQSFDLGSNNGPQLSSITAEDAYALEDQGNYPEFEKTAHQENLKKLAVPIGIGILVFIIIIYGMVRLFSGSKHESSPTPAIPSQSKIDKKQIPNQINLSDATNHSATALQQIELPSLEAKKTNSDIQQNQLQLTKIQEALGTLQVNFKTEFEKTENNLENSLNDIQDLQKQTIQNAQAIQGLSNQVNSLNNKVDEIATGLEKMIQLIKQATSPSIARQSNPNATPAPSYQQPETGNIPEHMPPAYYVQAIIPGRAWLKDAQGKVISVGIGDQIPGFGTVTQIQPRSGTVQTSAGITIEYGISQY